MTVKERFNSLVEKKEEANRKIVQLETKKDSAEESLKTIEEDWKKNMGIESYEEAKKKCEELEKEINDAMDQCEQFLSKAGV